MQPVDLHCEFNVGSTTFEVRMDMGTAVLTFIVHMCSTRASRARARPKRNKHISTKIIKYVLWFQTSFKLVQTVLLFREIVHLHTLNLEG